MSTRWSWSTPDRRTKPPRSPGRREPNVHHFEWCDSFAAARNEAIAHASSDWILVIDADDRLLPRGGDSIRRAVRNAADGYAMWIEECQVSGAVLGRAVTSVRLFRNDPQIRYHGRIHEEVQLGDNRRNGRWYGISDGPHLRHFGYDPEVWRDRDKAQRNERLLLQQLADNPGDPHTLVLMTRFHYDRARDDEARSWMIRCLLADQHRGVLMPAEREFLGTAEARLRTGMIEAKLTPTHPRFFATSGLTTS